MLAEAARKPYADKVEWIHSSAQHYKSDRRFDLVLMTGHTFQIFLSDEDAAAVLSTMRGHLKEGGRVAFETRNPQLDWAGKWAAEPPIVRWFSGSQLRQTLQIVEAGEGFISFQRHYDFGDTTLSASSSLRFPSRKQVEVLLLDSGLVVRDLFGDWDQSPFDAARSPEMIFVTEIAA
jgi:hypothetical protein